MKQFLTIYLLICFCCLGVGEAQQQNFSGYGYFDLKFKYDPSNKRSTFDIHHFNLITIYSYEQLRVFAEVEWEHGPVIESDPNEVSEGEIGLERIYAEYIFNDRFRFRAGKFLTPFGIYNLIHDATPTFLTDSVPLLYDDHDPFGVNKGRLYGKLYTGLQLSGVFRMSPRMRIRYALGMGNGRSDKQFSDDNDTNKSLLGRVQAEFDHLELGASHYRDRNANGLSGKPTAKEEAWGVDATAWVAGLRLRSEYALFRMEKVAGGFQSAQSYYFQASHRIGEYVTPVIRYDYFDPNRSGANDGYGMWLLGVNVSPHPQIYLKSEVQFHFSDVPGTSSSRYYVSSVSVAF